MQRHGAEEVAVLEAAVHHDVVRAAPTESNSESTLRAGSASSESSSKRLARTAAPRLSVHLTDYARSKGIYMRINFVNPDHVHALIDLRIVALRAVPVPDAEPQLADLPPPPAGLGGG